MIVTLGSTEELTSKLSDIESSSSAIRLFASQLQEMHEQDKIKKRLDIDLTSMPKRKITFNIHTIGLTPKVFTPKGVPQVSAAVLKKLAGQNLFGDGIPFSS